jgi:hypothetical protein
LSGFPLSPAYSGIKKGKWSDLFWTGTTGQRAKPAQPMWLTFFAESVNGQLLRFLKPASHFAMINSNFR